MSNISNKLKELFNAYLNRIEEEKKHPKVTNCTTYNHRYPTIVESGSNKVDYSIGVLHFYEWSNIYSMPKNFYTMDAFENFLMRSGIFIAAFQKEIIRNIRNCYIACKNGSTELLIKASFDELKKALESDNKEPYSVAITRPPIIASKPPMYANIESRWPEMETVGEWYG